MPLIIFFILSFFSAISISAKVLVFGVVPQQSPFEIKKDWEPIIGYLQKSTGEKIVFKTERSIPEFEKVLMNGGYDIAYMSPSHYVSAHQQQKYNALVRSHKSLIGILVVRKDSGIKDYSQLKDKTFLFPSPGAFAATVINKYELEINQGIKVVEGQNLRYVNSHDSVYKGVARGIGDVGGGIERTFKDLDDIETKSALMILYKTEPYPSHPIAIKSTVPKPIQDKISKALINAPASLLAPLKMEHIVQTSDKEYDSVRNMSKILPKMGY